MEDWTEK